MTPIYIRGGENMAYLFIGVFLIVEGLHKLGYTIGAKEIVQGICLLIAGVIFALQSVGLF